MRSEFYFFLEANYTDELQQLTFFLKNRSDKAGVRNADTILSLLRLFPQFLASRPYQLWLEHTWEVSFEGEWRTPSELEGIFSNAGIPDLGALRRLMVSSVYHIPGCNNLLQKESWFRSLVESVDNIDVPVFITLPSFAKNFPVLYVNSKIEAVTGFARFEIMGTSCRFYHLNAIFETMQLWKKLAGSTPTKFYITYQSKNGSQIPMVVICKPVYDMYGAFRFIINAASSDLSEKSLRLLVDFLNLVPNYFTG